MEWQYTRGLHAIGQGVFAWLQPDGGWGWSNAGLVVDGDQSLLVDTLFDVPRTREMLAAMADAAPAAARIDAAINTHANGDHWYGNQLVAGATILATEAAAAEMRELPPHRMAALMRLARGLSALPGPLKRLPLGGVSAGELGGFFLDCFGAFEFAGAEATYPTQTFSGGLRWRVGDREVELIEVGPAHTRGDALVYVPSARVVFTGDILFSSGHPIAWAGPIANWIAACERILGMDVEVVVPGHGPLADKAAVRRLRDYLSWLSAEARARFDAGLSAAEAARSLDLAGWSDWGEAERVVVNIDTVYRELRGAKPGAPALLFQQMAAIKRDGI